MTRLPGAIHPARPVTPIGILAQLLEGIEDQLDINDGVDAGWRQDLLCAF